MRTENLNYITRIKGKSAEEILSAQDSDYSGPIGEYLRVAAQIRTNQELATTLAKASDDSGKLQSHLFWLTIVIAVAAIAQAFAAAWPVFHNG